MGLSLKPDHLRRYRDIAALLLKYGRSDLVSTPARMDEPDASHATAADGDDLADDLEALGPTFVKVGQLLSTRADLLPPEALRSLSRLQDDVEPFPLRGRRADRQRGTRRPPLEGVLALRSPRRIAAASLGQVHRAALRDGREVAVKVQRPNVREQVLKDMETMDEVADFLDHHTEPAAASG